MNISFYPLGTQDQTIRLAPCDIQGGSGWGGADRNSFRPLPYPWGGGLTITSKLTHTLTHTPTPQKLLTLEVSASGSASGEGVALDITTVGKLSYTANPQLLSNSYNAQWLRLKAASYQWAAVELWIHVEPLNEPELYVETN